MNKLKIYISSLVFVFCSAFAGNAVDMPTINADGLAIGLTGSAGAYHASGTETENDEKDSEERIMGFGYASVFIEYAIEPAFGITIGVDYVPETLGVNATSRTDVASEWHKSVAGSALEKTGGCVGGNNCSTNTVDAEFKDLTTLYVLVPVPGTNAFLKAGMKRVDVITLENLATGSSYNDETLDGTMLGFGWNRNFDGGVFLRMAADYTEFDKLSLTSSTNSANTVTAEIEGITASLSIGKSF